MKTRQFILMIFFAMIDLSCIVYLTLPPSLVTLALMMQDLDTKDGRLQKEGKQDCSLHAPFVLCPFAVHQSSFSASLSCREDITDHLVQ